MPAWLNNIKQNPLEFIMGVSIFVIALGGGAIGGAASTSIAVMFLASLFYISSWKATWQQLDPLEKALCYGFILFLLSGAISWIHASDTVDYIKQMGRYIRFVLAIPVYLVLRYNKIDVLRYLYAGIVVSGFVYLGMGIHHLHVRPDFPASGYYHHITYGDAIMLNAGLMIIMLLEKRRGWLLDAIILLSAICALYASFLSQARGAWIVLPVYLFIYVVYFSRDRLTALKMLVVAFVAGTLIMLSPVGSLIKERYNQAKADVTEYSHGKDFDSSLGGRFAMWNIAYDVWKKHPLIGTGLGDFARDMKHYQDMGMYPGAPLNDSTHNIFIQAFAGTGIIGFFAIMIALVIAPLRLFYKNLGNAKIAALMGMITALSYIVFGLSESWILRAPAVSIYIAFTLILAASLKNKKIPA